MSSSVNQRGLGTVNGCVRVSRMVTCHLAVRSPDVDVSSHCHVMSAEVRSRHIVDLQMTDALHLATASSRMQAIVSMAFRQPDANIPHGLG